MDENLSAHISENSSPQIYLKTLNLPEQIAPTMVEDISLFEDVSNL